MNSAFYIAATVVFISTATLAQNYPGNVQGQEKPDLATVMHNMRMKQEGEEQRVLRFVQPSPSDESRICPADMRTRHRLEKIGIRKDGKGDRTFDDVIINAGNSNTSVTDNHGEINNSVNVQVVKDGKDEQDPCL